MIRVGVFFDGTGNNKWNDTLIDDGSVSNIAKLHTLYEASGYITLYAEGIGTQNYKRGNPLNKTQIQSIQNGEVSRIKYYDKLGLAIGSGSKKIVKKKINELRKIIDSNTAEEIIVDVYGFSRGATKARDFINKIREKYAGTKHSNIFGFVGLFDTVASMGIRGPINIGYNLNLNSESAKKIVHIVSRDEKRVNFPLESILTKDEYKEYETDNEYTVELNNIEEIKRIGVHADIGGGYGKYDSTRKLIGKKKKLETVYQDRNARQTLARIVELHNEANLNDISIEYRHEKRPSSLNDYDIYAYDIEDRNIEYGLSNVYLNLMYKKIRDFNVELVGIDELGSTYDGYSHYKQPNSVNDDYVHISSSDYWYDRPFADILANSSEWDGERDIYYNEPSDAI